jgi:hypothetical protein
VRLTHYIPYLHAAPATATLTNPPKPQSDHAPTTLNHRNHSSTTVVNGQTFGQWFKDTYIFDAQGTSPLVSGFYFDDYVGVTRRPLRPQLRR